MLLLPLPCEDIGFPITRRRYLAAAINQETLIWVGPLDASSMATEFWSIFQCSVQLEADDMVVLDTFKNHQALLKELAKKRNAFPSDDDSLALEAVLSPSQRRFLDGYHAIMSNRRRLGARGSFCADISQDPRERPRCGAWLPTLARSSALVSVSRGSFFTNKELDFAMGFPAIPFPGNEAFRECVGYPVHDMDRSTYSKLIGNGMHVASMMAFWAYILSNIVRRDVVDAWMPDYLPFNMEKAKRRMALAGTGVIEVSDDETVKDGQGGNYESPGNDSGSEPDAADAFGFNFVRVVGQDEEPLGATASTQIDDSGRSAGGDSSGFFSL